jgi:hypothetical protein
MENPRSDKKSRFRDNPAHENSLVLVPAAVIVGLAGCNLKEKYARNNLAADQWLQANHGAQRVLRSMGLGRRTKPAGGHPLSASRPHGEWRDGKLFCSRRNARFASLPGFEFRRLRLLHSHPQSQRRHPERVLLLVRSLQFGRSGSGHSAAPSRLTEHHPAGASEGHPFREAPNKNVST